MAMHLMAVMAVALVGLALAIVSVGSSSRSAGGSVEQATAIEGLPFRDDAIDPPPADDAPDEPRPSCMSPTHTAWYVLVPESDLPLTTWAVPDLDEAGTLDAGIAVWAEQADGSLVESGCVDDHGAGGPEQLVMTARGGLAYYIGVSAVDRPESGEGTLTFLAQRQQPEHDLFAFAKRVGTTPYRDVDVDAAAARREPGEVVPSCADLAATTWYAISSPEDATLSATVVPAEGAEDGLDVAVALHSGGAVDSLLEVACSDSGGINGVEHLEAPIFGDEEYWIQVGAVLAEGAGPGGYTLSVAGIQTIDLRPLPDTILGAGPAAISAVASSGLPVALDVMGPCHVRDRALIVDGAGLCTVTASQAGDADWAPAATVATTLRVARGRQTIDVEPVVGAVVGEPVVVNATADSGLDVRLDAAGACTFDGAVLQAERAGICTVTATQPGDADWAPAEPVSASVLVGRGRQGIELAPLDRTAVGADPIRVTAKSDAGLPVVLHVDGPCEVHGASLRVLGSGSCTVTATQAGDADWAAAEPVSTTVRIGRGQQAIELEPLPEAAVFGDAPIALAATSESGLPVSLAAEGACALEGAALVSTAAGSCTVTATQPGDADWRPAEPVTASITIAPASQAIELEPLPEAAVFGDAPIALAATSESGLPVSLAAEGACALEGAALVSTAAGSCTVTATQPGDADWRPAEPVTASITIAPASQAIELEPIGRLSVGESVALIATAGSGLPVSLEASGPCLIDGSTSLRVLGSGSCTVTATQAGDADWAAAEPVSTTVRIGRGQQAIELEPLPEAAVFGDAPIALAATSESGLPVSLAAEGACALEGAALVSTAAGSCTVTATQPGDADWRPAEPVTASITIAPASQAIELEPLPEAAVFGDAPIALAATSESGLPVSLAAEGACALEGAALVSTAAGSCTVTATQPGDADWRPAEPVTASITIAPASQAIELEPIGRLSVGESVALIATAGSGLPVSLEASGPCLIDGSTSLRVLGSGSCTVTATQAGDADWAAAEPVSTTVRIGRGQQAIELEPLPEAAVFGDAPIALAATSESGLPVSLAVEGACALEGAALVSTAAGSCTVTATQPGDADWRPAEPVTASITIAPASQAIELEPIGPQLLGVGPIELRAVASSGLPVRFSASGACRADAATILLLSGGKCTVTATQTGDASWAPAEASATFRVVAPITGERVGLSDPALGSLPGVLVADGARISAAFEPGEPVSQHYAVALDEGQLLEVGGLETGVALSVAGPTSLVADDVDWTDIAVDADTGVARWVASESGIHSLRVDGIGTASGPADAYTISVDVDPGVRPVVTRHQSERALLDRLRSLRCQTLDEEQEPRTFDGGALAGVRCRRPASGVFELKLFTFPDAGQLGSFHEARVDEIRPDVLALDRACRLGRSGVRAWEHGRIACWSPKGRSRGVLHWTDERTNTYGIMRTLTDENRIRLRLWGELLRRIS